MRVELLGRTTPSWKVCATAAGTCTSARIPEEPGFKALRHAISSGHESVLEHANFTFAIEGISRACSHQLVRHRIASYSQQSQRYVKMDDFDIVTPQSIKDNMDAWDDYATLVQYVHDLYDVFVNDYHIPEEDARYILPNACCTNIVVTMNARELRHFFGLRLCKRAQWEIRELAESMLEVCKAVDPELFEDVGPQCEHLGYCPETRGCGHRPKRVVL